MKTTRPNILLISTDQQRFDTIAGFGPSFLRTQHMDQLCHEGITFTSAYTDCPLCVPSRTSIMTGKTVFTHGMLSNGRTSEVMGNHDTLPGQMAALDYQTVAIGTMHFSPRQMRHGFQEMHIASDYYREMTRYGHNIRPTRNGLGGNELLPSLATVPENFTLTSWTAEKCVEFFTERRDPSVPFFVWCSFEKPHPPFDVPEPYYSMYRNSPIPEPVYGDWSAGERCPESFKRWQQMNCFDLMSPELIKEARSAYYGLITQVDNGIGRIFSALNTEGLLDDTLILFTTDHGEFLGDHHSGSKWFFHQASAHIPFVLRLPKSWDDRHPGTFNSSLACHADILPTLLTAAGGKPPAGVDGQDLIALTRGQLREPRRYLEAMSAFQEYPTYFAITDGRWKYIYYPEGAQEQLFDLQTDPQELKDLGSLKKFESKRKELQQVMIQRHAQRKSKYLTGDRLISKPVDKDTVEERRNGVTKVAGHFLEMALAK